MVLSGHLAFAPQDSSKPALQSPARQAPLDSAGTAKQSSPPETPAKQQELSKKDFLTSTGGLISALVALIGLVFIVYLSRKKKEAELKAEYEFKRRTELEERQREVEKRLALLEAEHNFVEKTKKQQDTQKAKTAEERYLYILENEVCQIHLAAPGIEGVPVSLIDTFVRLNISEHYRSEDFPLLGDAGRGARDHEDLSPEEVLLRAFHDYRRKLLLIIGDPGSGKTTLLKYYAMCCLEPQGFRKLGFSRPLLPMFLPLREVDPDQSLADNLSLWARKHDPHIPADQFHAWLDERDTLVLLDGLDEVSKLGDRKNICDWIDQRCAGLKRAHFVFTSRGTGMRSADNLFLRTPHLHAEVRDFSHAQKQEFLRKWFRAAHLEGSRPRKDESRADWEERQLREAEKNAAEVIDYLDQKDNRSLRELAGIPMLLQLLALIWKHYKSKPESRTKLYDIALDYLLEYRDDQRGLAPLLKADKARRVLSPAALWMQEVLNAEEAAKDRMHEFLKPILEPIDNKLTAKDLCENLRDRASIIADYGKDEYIFRHKSFREYFAGMHLVSAYDDGDRLAKLVATFGDNSWAEPLRYFLSKADGKAFTSFMARFFDSGKSRELSGEQQDLLLALVREAPERPTEALIDCLQNDSRSQNQQRYALDSLKTIGGERVQEFLESYVKANKGKQSTLAYAREIAAQLSAPGLSEARKKIERNLFIEPAASFRNPVENNAEYILIRGGTIKYSATQKIEKVPDLYFAKYPATNKQYRRFIRYLQGEDAELDKVVLPKTFAEKLLEFAANDKAHADYIGRDPKTWPEKLKSTYDEDRKFNGDEQPIVGVSWYAAHAYCFWLSLLDAGMREPGLGAPVQQLARTFRLPSEVEWERAAAGRIEDPATAGRKYPWPAEKGEPNPKLANYYEGKVGQTTPVGRYPEGATPEGLMDMAGNVWEWQENWYDEKDKTHRALRGGSWSLDADTLRCTNRNWDNPLVRYYIIGFRVVRAQSFFDTL
jgi:formylglycine-generating enzyme required for sulfatase activity